MSWAGHSHWMINRIPSSACYPAITRCWFRYQMWCCHLNPGLKLSPTIELGIPVSYRWLALDPVFRWNKLAAK